MKKILLLTFIALFALNAIFLNIKSADAVSQAGTTLSASKTANGHWTNTFGWTIDKAVTPAVWNLFNGDDGTSRYTVSVTKDSGATQSYIDGQVCVTNGGSVATENLQIIDNLSMPPSQVVIASTSLDLSAKPVLQPGESFCYDYKLDIPTSSLVGGASYKDTADITITNHSGYLNVPFGPGPSATTVFPSSAVLVNDTISVDDTNGQSWNFSSSTAVNYDKKFTCPADSGEHINTATIAETGQAASTTVSVNCFALSVSKTARESLDRKYDWSIEKSANKSDLSLQIGEAFSVNYLVTVDATSSDANWAAMGTITVTNPAPVSSTLLNVADLVSGGFTGTVTCPMALPGILPASSSVVCNYAVGLPDGSDRVNTATATIQNFSYDPNLVATSTVSSDFVGTTTINFASSTINVVDETIDVTDSLQGLLGSVTAGVDALPKTFSYSRNVGSYSVCGDYSVPNISSFVTNDTAATSSSSWNVSINVPCNLGCTFTIGYWKNHAGFGPQDDVLSQYLPIMFGNTVPQGLNVSSAGIARDILTMKTYGSPSNGITKLYAQLLAAKLNIANGASSASISATITAADNFLSTHSYTTWNSLSKVDKNKVLGWMGTLGNFNNGSIGPGHCSI